MSELHIPDLVDLGVRENVCLSTKQGWLWYCDLHDTHGNADFEDEARACAEAHENAWFEAGAADPDGCDFHIWQRSSHERVE